MNLRSCQCPYWLECLRRISIHDEICSKLDLNQPHGNKCFCLDCHQDRRDYDVIKKEDQIYQLPIFYSAFAVKLTHGKEKTEEILKNWVTAYHGTSLENLRIIAKNGFILRKPGDKNGDGSVVKIRKDAGRIEN